MKPVLTPFLLLTATASMSLAAEPAERKRPYNVPTDAQPFQGKWYLAYPGAESWTVANEKCHNLGGSLAIIDSEKTQEFIAKLANRRIFWLGATNESGDWKWLDGTKFTYTNWMAGQPSNAKNHEHWLAIGKGGQWFDIGQKAPMVQGFICEWKGK